METGIQEARFEVMICGSLLGKWWGVVPKDSQVENLM